MSDLADVWPDFLVFNDPLLGHGLNLFPSFHLKRRIVFNVELPLFRREMGSIKIAKMIQAPRMSPLGLDHEQ